MPYLTDFGAAFGGGDSVISEMYIEMMIQRIGRRTWRPRSRELRIEGTHRSALWPWSCELRHTPGGRNQGSLEMHWDTVIVQTWRPWTSEFGDELGDHNCENLEAMIEQEWRSTWRLSVGGMQRCKTLFISYSNSQWWEYDMVVIIWALMHLQNVL